MVRTGYWIRQCGQMYICNLTDRYVCASTLVFQTMGNTARQAVRRMNRLLKPYGYKVK